MDIWQTYASGSRWREDVGAGIDSITLQIVDWERQCFTFTGRNMALSGVLFVLFCLALLHLFLLWHDKGKNPPKKPKTIKVTWFPVFRLSIFLLTSCTAGFHSIFLEAPSLCCWQQHVRSKLVVGFAVLWTIGHMCCIFVCSPKLNCYQTLTTGAKGGCLIKETWDLKFLHNL